MLIASSLDGIVNLKDKHEYILSVLRIYPGLDKSPSCEQSPKLIVCKAAYLVATRFRQGQVSLEVKKKC